MKRGPHWLETEVGVVTVLDLAEDFEVCDVSEIIEVKPVGLDSEGNALEDLVVLPVKPHDGLFFQKKNFI